MFSTVTTGNVVDGIAFDPTGNFLFMANDVPSGRLTIVDRSGGLVQQVNMSVNPDGIAFHAATPKFVVTNNTNGTMTRFGFPGNDFTMVPVQSVFASGGSYGDLAQVGPDGCLYAAQGGGTRYDDGRSRCGRTSPLAR
jgi:DNA-binding beta-propeller fold protein YncE